MKRTLALFALSAAGLLAGEWTGFISDSHCGAKHTAPSDAATKCVNACIKGGAKPVLVTADKKVLKIDDPAKVSAHLAHTVTITGELEGDTIKVATVKAK